MKSTALVIFLVALSTSAFADTQSSSRNYSRIQRQFILADDPSTKNCYCVVGSKESNGCMSILNCRAVGGVCRSGC